MRGYGALPDHADLAALAYHFDATRDRLPRRACDRRGNKTEVNLWRNAWGRPDAGATPPTPPTPGPFDHRFGDDRFLMLDTGCAEGDAGDPNPLHPSVGNRGRSIERVSLKYGMEAMAIPSSPFFLFLLCSLRVSLLPSLWSLASFLSASQM